MCLLITDIKLLYSMIAEGVDEDICVPNMW